MKTLKSLILLSALSCLLLSCSEDNQNVYKVDPALSVHVDAFFSEASGHGKTIAKSNLSAEVKTTLQTVIEAGINPNGQRYIYFNSQALNTYSAEQVELMIFHKLGSIVLMRPYTNNDGVPTNDYSIMNPDMIYGVPGYTDQNGNPCSSCRAVLLNELFE